MLLDPNRTVSSERLIEALWEDDPPETAQKALQVYVSQLRKQLGRERLETHSSGYRLRVEPGELDADRFRSLAAESLARDAVGFAAESDFLDSHGDALTDLAEVLSLAGHRHDAAAALRQALRLYEQKGNTISAGRVQARLGEPA